MQRHFFYHIENKLLSDNERKGAIEHFTESTPIYPAQ